MKRYLTAAAKTSLILVYLVIVAGALVRMTGSGMGCPDWPKCFGYYIPPTDQEQLTWRAHKTFESGQVIIKDEALWVAKSDFKTADLYEPNDWRPYTKHDYAIFNPTHTWIEYLNRLCGALAGIAVLAMAVTSFSHRKSKPGVVWLSWLTVILMGFQAWLGATVVYSVLNPIKITVHMVVALLIVAVILYIIKSTSARSKIFKHDALFGNLLIFSLLLTLIQIVMGTQVRQFVDGQVKISGHGQMGGILDNPIMVYYFHRSFSILVLAVNLFLYARNSKKALGFRKLNWVIALLILEIFSGIAMAYFAFPFGSQTLHLVLTSILFGLQFYLVMECERVGDSRKKSI